MAHPPKLSGRMLPLLFLAEVGACPGLARWVTCSCDVGGAAGPPADVDCAHEGNPKAARKASTDGRKKCGILMKRAQQPSSLDYRVEKKVSSRRP